MATRTGRVRIGISGWRYAGWRGDFYPEGLPQRAEMEYACARYPTVEINGTFYSLQRKAYFEAWRDATADDFVFAVKGSRFITHMKQLNDPAQPLANFFGQGVLALGDKLGPILWQFSQRFRYREDRLRPFVEMLPIAGLKLHVTPVTVVSVTLAVNCWLCDAVSEEDVGEMLTVMGFRYTVAFTEIVGVALLVAVTMTVWADNIKLGAV
jgi:uncharacterized protein YecE (DUF72 family)